MSAEVLVSRDGQQYGPYSLDELQQHIADGVITPDDLAWIGGDQTDWQPLRELVEIEFVEEEGGQRSPAAPPPPPASSPTRSEVIELPSKEKPKPSIFARVWRVIFVASVGIGCLVAIAAVVGVMMGGPKDSEPRPSLQERMTSSMEEKIKEAARGEILPGKGPAIEVSIGSLAQSYRENAVAADGEYKGRLIRTGGVVGQIDRNPITGDPYVILVGHLKGMAAAQLGHVRLEFRNDAEVKDLKATQFIVIEGACQGADVTNTIRVARVKILDVADPHAKAREGIDKMLNTLGQ